MLKKKPFKLGYVGVSKDTYSVLYHKMGDYSVVLSLVNSVQKYCGDSAEYESFHGVFTNILKVLGEGYTIQKHDIFSKKTYKGKDATDYLGKKYFNHFKGRKYNDIETYLTITRTVTRSAFFQYDKRDFENFIKNITKVRSLLRDAGFLERPLENIEVELFIKRYLAVNFADDNYSIRNFKVTNEKFDFGATAMKVISLVDIDEVNLPNEILTHTNLNFGYKFPVDLLSFLHTIPDCDTVIYNQVIRVPNQKREIIKLEGKKKKHSSVPDPANDLCVEDIDNVLALIARSNELLVYCHYDVILSGPEKGVELATNYLESHLFAFGLIPSMNSFNQKELFTASFPGHTHDLQEYDEFFTTSDPAVSLLYKEAPIQNEVSDFQIYLTDRKGLPVAIDTSDLPMETGRINNRNKFVLGPSGSGKSFFMNTMVKQYFEQDTDIILVDTGHSYSGLCEYYGGRYISYSEEKPITMNPFLVTREELNEEKKDFIKSLIALLWKGADGDISQMEDSMLIKVVADFYRDYFETKTKVKSLNFNSFYDFSIDRIREIRDAQKLHIDVEEYAFILEKFYKGGEYDTILNSEVDSSLFDEKFIVFEIDNIKDNKVLFPITTLIIMDVFLQKMRHKSNRKALIIEEAWKAIASKLMAGYILYVYKTVRKFWGEAIVVTQELEDIIGNEIVKNSIINNSDTIILLDQAKFKENYQEVANLLSLSKVEQNKIFTINNLENKDNRSRFKEVYIKRGSKGEVYGVEVSMEEYLTYTTEKREKQAIARYLEKYPDYTQAIDHFIIDLKQSGLSIPKFSAKVMVTELEPIHQDK